jgi:hypothetical protein
LTTVELLAKGSFKIEAARKYGVEIITIEDLSDMANGLMTLELSSKHLAPPAQAASSISPHVEKQMQGKNVITESSSLSRNQDAIASATAPVAPIPKRINSASSPAATLAPYGYPKVPSPTHKFRDSVGAVAEPIVAQGSWTSSIHATSSHGLVSSVERTVSHHICTKELSLAMQPASPKESVGWRKAGSVTGLTGKKRLVMVENAENEPIADQYVSIPGMDGLVYAQTDSANDIVTVRTISVLDPCASWAAVVRNDPSIRHTIVVYNLQEEYQQ